MLCQVTDCLMCRFLPYDCTSFMLFHSIKNLNCCNESHQIKNSNSDSAVQTKLKISTYLKSFDGLVRMDCVLEF